MANLTKIERRIAIAKGIFTNLIESTNIDSYTIKKLAIIAKHSVVLAKIIEEECNK